LRPASGRHEKEECKLISRFNIPSILATLGIQCVLIAVLGGIDPNGGFGNIAGVTLAIFILQFLSSGLNMSTTSPTSTGT